MKREIRAGGLIFTKKVQYRNVKPNAGVQTDLKGSATNKEGRTRGMVLHLISYEAQNLQGTMFKKTQSIILLMSKAKYTEWWRVAAIIPWKLCGT